MDLNTCELELNYNSICGENMSIQSKDSVILGKYSGIGNINSGILGQKQWYMWENTVKLGESTVAFLENTVVRETVPSQTSDMGK